MGLSASATGFIAGNLLGTQLGVASIPERWLVALELRDVIDRVAIDLDSVLRTYGGECGEARPHDDEIWQRYPGW